MSIHLAALLHAVVRYGENNSLPKPNHPFQGKATDQHQWNPLHCMWQMPCPAPCRWSPGCVSSPGAMLRKIPPLMPEGEQDCHKGPFSAETFLRKRAGLGDLSPTAGQFCLMLWTVCTYQSQTASSILFSWAPFCIFPILCLGLDSTYWAKTPGGVRGNSRTGGKAVKPDCPFKWKHLGASRSLPSANWDLETESHARHTYLLLCKVASCKVVWVVHIAIS